MPHLAHLLLSVPQSILSTPPSFWDTRCNFIHSIAPLLGALATARPAGVGVCPRLRHIRLWHCDGAEPPTPTRLVKLRNGYASAGDLVSRDDFVENRPMKPLPKGAHSHTARQLPLQYMGTNNEPGTAKVEQVSVEICRPITKEDAMSLRQWGVEVQWTAMEI